MNSCIFTHTILTTALGAPILQRRKLRPSNLLCHSTEVKQLDRRDPCSLLPRFCS